MELSVTETVIGPPLALVALSPPPVLFSICDRSIDITALPLPVGATRIPEAFL